MSLSENKARLAHESTPNSRNIFLRESNAVVGIESSNGRDAYVTIRRNRSCMIMVSENSISGAADEFVLFVSLTEPSLYTPPVRGVTLIRPDVSVGVPDIVLGTLLFHLLAAFSVET